LKVAFISVKNGFVNKKTPISEINAKIERIEKNAIHTVFRKDVIQSKNQTKSEANQPPTAYIIFANGANIFKTAISATSIF